MNLIVAVDKNWGIGYRGELLARVRADLKHFAALTTGRVVVLGSKTLSTFPGKRPLKNRTNIVLSRREDFRPEGAIVVRSEAELLDELKIQIRGYFRHRRRERLPAAAALLQQGLCHPF